MLKKIAKNLFRKFGFDLISLKGALPKDMEPGFWEIYNRCKPFSMTSIERMYALYKGVEYIVKNNIKGDLVECGVWRGGSAMVMAFALQQFGDTNRKIFLYDTFEGMSEPTEKDVDIQGHDAAGLMKETLNDKENSVWCLADLDDVTRNMQSTGYDFSKLVFVKGKVEETIPATLPGPIALLRLDTDWYESTWHEMVHLYPMLVKTGVLIVDDYGHWKGSRDAVDKYLEEKQIPLLLNRIDYTGRIAIKTN